MWRRRARGVREPVSVRRSPGWARRRPGPGWTRVSARVGLPAESRVGWREYSREDSPSACCRAAAEPVALGPRAVRACPLAPVRVEPAEHPCRSRRGASVQRGAPQLPMRPRCRRRPDVRRFAGAPSCAAADRVPRPRARRRGRMPARSAGATRAHRRHPAPAPRGTQRQLSPPQRRQVPPPRCRRCGRSPSRGVAGHQGLVPRPRDVNA